ncbi:MAG: ABC transporter ATP-binding protein [Alphaproteobacteria bacterium]|nr:ABC transporter ATP-binding protein [Alphaproteobacteria bacterium]
MDPIEPAWQAQTGTNEPEPPAVEVRGLRTQFGTQVIHDNLDLAIRRGEVFGLVGGSGTGKSVLVRTIIGLIRPRAGEIRVFGQDTQSAGAAAQALRRRWGVMFQDGALFSSLTVGENIDVPLKEHTRLKAADRREIVALKLRLSGLDPSVESKYPSELSGGMRKRAGLARALALDPQIVFLDEPTAGLDPIGAAHFDELVLELQSALGLTVVMITHDLDSLYTACNRIGVLLNKQAICGTIQEIRARPEPWIHDYFNGPRGRAAAYAGAA